MNAQFAENQKQNGTAEQIGDVAVKNAQKNSMTNMTKACIGVGLDQEYSKKTTIHVQCAESALS